jgi:hypothetical protein
MRGYRLAQPDCGGLIGTKALLLRGMLSQAPLNATIETLGGQIKQMNKQDKEIFAFYRTALKNFPEHHALIYDYAELLLQDRQYKEALETARRTSQPRRQRSETLRTAGTRLCGAGQTAGRASHARLLPRRPAGHNRPDGLAKQSGNDYYQLSTIETELKQYREIAAAYSKKK